MKNIPDTTKLVIEQGILPLFFHPDEIVSVHIIKALYNAGIRAVEYTNRGEAAFRNFTKLIKLKEQELPGLALGIGTIKNLMEAKSFLSAGADFLVSPGYVPEVARFSMDKDVFYAPGCMTPGEIIAAENAGIRFIKLFPGNLLGPEYLTGIKDIFPKLYFMPTGGVDTTQENLEAWFNAGVCAVGMGSKLVSKKLMEAKDYATIEADTKIVLQRIADIKKSQKII